ncbi:MAG: transcription initiation factor IIB family protein [Candidatus Geothermarchaeales archaeon]
MSRQKTLLKLGCENCGEMDSYIRRSDELICTNCGYVVLRHIITTEPEWRSFDGDDSKVRVGMPPTLLMQDKGLSTLIGRENEDSTGKRIASGTVRDLNRLRKWQRRMGFQSSREKNLAYSLNELNKVARKLKVPPAILQTASYVYRMAMEKKLVRGRSIKNLIVAALYVAIRFEGFPRSLKELSQASGIDKRHIALNFKVLVRGLGIKLPIADPVIFVKRVCVDGGLHKRVMLDAQRIVRLAQAKRLTTGKDPVGLAAGAIYYACVLLGVDKTQRDVAEAAGVTELTVRNRYKHLSDELRLEAPTQQIVSSGDLSYS